MSRLKRFAVGTSVTLGMLVVAIPLWYQNHYMVSLDSPVIVALPNPNGFDTLQAALKLRVPQNVIREFPLDQPLAAREKLLAANQGCIARMRVGLQQAYYVPEVESQDLAIYAMAPYYQQAFLLEFAAKTYADSGNLPEAMQCALDSVELGIRIPRGGEQCAMDAGHRCEALGYTSAWKLADCVDAKTARYAAARLAQLEEQRWPASENLREDLRVNFLCYTLPPYENGPVGTWNEMATWSGSERRSVIEKAESLWKRAKTVYYGPKAYVDYAQDCVKNLQEQSRLLWGPQRPAMALPRDPLNMFDAPDFSHLELFEVTLRTRSALLQTYLALRAYWLEHGSYPDSLDSMVSSGDLKAVPADPFSPIRAPLGYRKDQDGETFTLWSVGPDARDDDGKTIQGDIWLDKENHYLRGDVVARITTFPNQG